MAFMVEACEYNGGWARIFTQNTFALSMGGNVMDL